MTERIIRQFDGRPIGSKAQSKELVPWLGLNTVDAILVTDLGKATRDFLKRYDLYGVRYMEFGRPSQYALTAPEVITFLRRKLPRFGMFRVEQSLRRYDAENMLIHGEFEWVLRDRWQYLSGYYNTERGHSLKEINLIGRPITPLVERTWLFKRVMGVLLLHNLKNVVVELTLYNCRVGMWRDDYICWELRNEY